MTTLQLDSQLSDIFGTLQIFDTPMFMVLVEPDGTMRFIGVNAAHQAGTGIQTAAIAGHTPHAILPPRVADTVVANYRRCVDAKGPISYEEVLELPSGTRWWNTTLVPVKANGRIAAIVGTAFDITKSKEQFDSSMAEIATLKRRVGQLQTLSRAAVSQMRGPLNNILSFCRILRPELRAPLDQKLEILDLMMETAVGALDEIDGFEAGGRGIVAAGGLAKFDFGHLCRDIAALADPGRNLNISFPDIEVEANAEAVRWITQSILDRLVPIVGQSVTITAIPDGRRAHFIRFLFDCHLLDEQTGHISADAAHWLASGVEARGGEFQVQDHASTRDEGRLELHITLPGRMIEHA